MMEPCGIITGCCTMALLVSQAIHWWRNLPVEDILLHLHHFLRFALVFWLAHGISIRLSSLPEPVVLPFPLQWQSLS